MSESLLLNSAIFVCAVMAVVNLLLVKRRGVGAYLLSLAFLVFGGTLYAYQHNLSQTLISFGALVVALLLIADFYYRTSRTK